MFGYDRISILEDNTTLSSIRAYIQLASKHQVVSFVNARLIRENDLKSRKYDVPVESLDSYVVRDDIDSILLVICHRFSDENLKVVIGTLKEHGLKLFKNYIFYETIEDDSFHDFSKYLYFYSEDEIEEGLKVLKNFKKLFTINGNCQISMLSKYLLSNKKFHKEYAYIRIPEIHVYNSRNNLNIDILIKYLDLIISQPIKETNKFETKLSSKYLKENMHSSAVFLSISNITSKLYFPQNQDSYRMNTFRLGGKNLFTYQDVIINNFIELGLNIDNIKEILSDKDLYDINFLDAYVANQLSDFKNREMDCDIKMFDFIQDNYNRTVCFHSFNHPKYFILKELAMRILKFLNITPEIYEEEEITIDMFNQEQPIYPSIHNYFNFDYFPDKEYYPNKYILNNKFSFERYIDVYYTTYKIANEKEVVKEKNEEYVFKTFNNLLYILSIVNEKYRLTFLSIFAKHFSFLMEEIDTLDFKLFDKIQLEALYQIISNPTEYYYNNSKICYNFLKLLPHERYSQVLARWFKEKTGEDLDLENPKTFNEKIQWLKLYDSTALKTRLADKYLVRDWVREQIGEEYLIPLLGVWDNFDDIDFDKLPNQFVLKCNHGAGMNIIVKDKSALNIGEIKIKINKWLNTNYAFNYGLELHYGDIKPKIMAESYMENAGDNLSDYKIFCFNGKPNCIEYLMDRHTVGLKVAFFDLCWNKLPFTNINYPLITNEISKPKNLDLMIQLAEKLAEGFAFVRVDFYVLNDGSVKFGEMTFTPASGAINWFPKEQNIVFGNLLELPY